MLIDSHAHISGETLYLQAEELIARAQALGVKAIVNICTDQLSAERGLELAKRYEGIYNVGATTPHDVEELGEQDFVFFEKLAEDKKLVAIGETGLDYHYEHSAKPLQQQYLIRYFELATRLNLPIVVHCREAFEDLFALAKDYYRDRPLLLHCFTGSKEEAKRALDLGWKISFSGIVTFKKSQSLQDVARFVPLEAMLIETDSPYLAPQSKRGQVNEPSFLVETAQYLAELKEVPFNTFASICTQNTLAFFSI
ncbi:MAG: TatD family deoxyribonuclease [Chlamydiae bacterium]|nr:TatD family deoxyribonuclease [Chlamydiota bacterium]